MLTFLSLWGIIEITYSSLKLHPFVPHKTFQAPYGFVASLLGIEERKEPPLLGLAGMDFF